MKREALLRLIEMLPCACQEDTCETCSKTMTAILTNRELRSLIFNNNKPQPVNST